MPGTNDDLEKVMCAIINDRIYIVTDADLVSGAYLRPGFFQTWSVPTTPLPSQFPQMDQHTRIPLSDELLPSAFQALTLDRASRLASSSKVYVAPSIWETLHAIESWLDETSTKWDDAQRLSPLTHSNQRVRSQFLHLDNPANTPSDALATHSDDPETEATS